MKLDYEFEKSLVRREFSMNGIGIGRWLEMESHSNLLLKALRFSCPEEVRRIADKYGSRT